ncbi:hypothetical protein C8Q75DRAFT_806689 [Abortiporus biennis]|nr:hypothetical protein C8Q75DRAFT_806689 [Abortiporus biennis]
MESSSQSYFNTYPGPSTQFDYRQAALRATLTPSLTNPTIAKQDSTSPTSPSLSSPMHDIHDLTSYWSRPSLSSSSPSNSRSPSRSTTPNIDPYDLATTACQADPFHIHNLEQEFCSNFSCCGLRLSGMHELLDHFENSHVIVVSKNGHQIYPPPCQSTSSTSSTSTSENRNYEWASASSSDAVTSIPGRGSTRSIILSFPQPNPPLSPDASEATPHPIPYPSHPRHDVSPAKHPYSYSSYLSKTRSQSICIPPSLLTVPKQNQLPLTHISNSQFDQDIDVGTIPPPSPTKKSKCTKSANNHTQKPQSFASLAALHDHRPSLVRKRDKIREKAFRCPRIGCTKSYLNPNGLKYHLEKGTCTFTPTKSDSSLYSSSSDEASTH